MRERAAKLAQAPASPAGSCLQHCPFVPVALSRGLQPVREVFHSTDKALSPRHQPAAPGLAQEMGYPSPTFLRWKSLDPRCSFPLKKERKNRES